MRPSTLSAALCTALLLALWAGSAKSGRNDLASDNPPTELDRLLWSEAEPSPPAWIDQAGRTLTTDGLRDKVVVVTFLKTECLITCVLRILELDKVAQALPTSRRREVAFLSVTVDPVRDDVARLRRFAEGLNVDLSRIRLIRGAPSAVAAMTSALRYPAAQAGTPPATVLLFDRRGRVAMSYGGDPLDGPRLLRDVLRLAQLPDGVGRPARTQAATSAAPL